MRKVKADFKLLKEYEQEHIKDYHNSKKPIVGDCIFLPDGQVVYFCSVYDDRGQTCEGGSFSLYDTGYISYSGGLDHGIYYSDISLTDEYYVLPIWFCHQGRLCANCAIYANIRCRVWKTKEGADLSGIPQIARLRKQKLKEQSETIVKLDSLGKPYREHLPEIIIYKDGLPDGLIELIEEETGLIFENSYRYSAIYWCQPKKLIQVDMIRSYKHFSFREECDWITHDPLLILSYKAVCKP
ncbi:hypothetical protein [Sphingobacterium siyangense]|uniref:hypothetical protein n=2 Tax=Sphingobacteriaceae TaxID=84566 RepID=UPI0030188612